MVETSQLGKLIPRYLSGHAYLELQNELDSNPNSGDVMPGCGGLRKLRLCNPRWQKGKRCAARVIYLHTPEVSQFLMLDIFNKNEKANLTATDKKQLRSLALKYNTRVIATGRAEKGGKKGETRMKFNATRVSLAERLKRGLNEGIQCAKGELTLRTVEIPSPPSEIAAEEVIALREKARMSQSIFARVLNVSTKTVQSWEQGQRKPSHAALRMLQIFRLKPQLVCEVAGMKIE